MKTLSYTLTLLCLFFSALASSEENAMKQEDGSNMEDAAMMININTADQETLMNGINGVGEKKAAAIIEYREKNGPFSAVEQLLEVPGIGPKTLADNISILSVTGDEMMTPAETESTAEDADTGADEDMDTDQAQ